MPATPAAFFRRLSRCLVAALLGLSLAVNLGRGLAAQTARQSAPELVETWGMDKGLPQPGVTAVLQTRDGYLWAGTEGGLARFDGMKFTTFRTTNTPGLVNHAVTELFEDRAGVLWIGTESGLMRYGDRTFTSIGLEGRRVLALAEDASGILWVGTDAGLHRWRNGSFETIHDEALPATPVQALTVDTTGALWLGFARWPGVVRYAEGKFSRVDTHGAVQAEVLAIAEEPRGVLWFGTGNGLVRAQNGAFTTLGSDEGLAGRQVTDLRPDRTGGLWVASTTLQRINGADPKLITTVRPLVTRAFNAIWCDREGNVWAGTAGDGLMCVRRASFELLALGASQVANGFRTVMEDPAGTLWLAQGALGFSQRAEGGEFVRTLPTADPSVGGVLAVYVSRAGDRWIGGRSALKRIRGETSEVYPQFADMRTMFEDSRGRMWFGGQDRAMVMWQEGKFAPVELPAGLERCTPSSFAETADGDIWVGTWNHGALRLNGSEVTVYDRTSGLPTNEMRCVYVDREDRVWVGTRGRGLGLFDRGQWLVPEWSADLFFQQINSVIEDRSDFLWLSSSRGVFKVPRADLAQAMRGALPLNRLAVRNVTEGLRQELADLACFPAAWRSRDGHLWFATRYGMLHIDATGETAAPTPPAVHLERVLVNGERQALAREITLPPNTQGLAIEYTGINFTAPGHVRFRYRLEGLEDAWVAADDRRMAHFARLRPGRYRFQVSASDATGVWSEPASFAIVQQGYFYQQPWVWWLSGGVLVLGIVGIFRWRTVAHERERLRLEVGIAERTRELRIAKEQAEASTRAKEEFLQGISHEIRNPLNGIIGLVAMLREAPLDARERELAHSLAACAKGLARVFDDVLNLAQLEHGGARATEKPFDLRALLDEVAALFRIMARQRGSEIVVRREGEVPERWIGDGEKIKSILGNFVSNALKYAPGSPVEILVQCDAADEFGAELTFNVTDGGPGIPAAEQERIFEKFVRGSSARNQRTPGTGLGLAACRALAELMGGHVAVESPAISAATSAGTSGGATFFLRVRLKLDRDPTRQPEPAATPVSMAIGRALIVEDQPYNQIVVQRIAERLGFVSEVAEHAEDALARLARQPCTVVFVDWELPGMKGDELTRRLRELPGGAETIVIATTAHNSDEIRQACLAAGMDGFALKPFEAETIARALSEARSRRVRRAGGDGLDTRVFRFVGYDDPRQAGQAAQLYLEILEQEVALLEGAMMNQDAAGAAAAAHRIKSHAGLVDAVDLRNSADRLQREARSVPAVALAGLQQDLVRHAGALRERLKSWRDEDAAG